MSADEWRVCPKCKIVFNKIKSDKKKKVESIFEEWLGKKIDSDVVQPIGESMREDYEILTNDNGFFSVKYNASCDVCGFEFKYSFSENTLLEK